VYAVETVNVSIGGTTERSTFGDAALFVFLVAQVCDGVLTYVGVSTFGRQAEANPIIVWLMSALGDGPGLAAAKLTAGGFGILLHLSAVHKAVAALAGFYVVAAVCPWVALLYIWP
jgi:hypothetical protein